MKLSKMILRTGVLLSFFIFIVRNSLPAGEPTLPFSPDGHPTTDPNLALHGAIRVFDR
jgi:hypothetical protein